MIDEVYDNETYQTNLEKFCKQLLENEESYDNFIDEKKDFFYLIMKKKSRL